MYFEAISIGDAVPRADFDAAVHSVFQSAINLRIIGGDNLLTLVASSEADLPQGIRVNTPDDFSFEICHASEKVFRRDDILRFASSPLTIDLRGAGSFNCDLSALQADMENPAVATAWRCVWQILNKRQTQLNAEIIADDLIHLEGAIRAGVSRKAGEAMRNLFESTRRYNLTVDSSVLPLIGLGSGLTPSGDDLLVGYMAGLRCAAKGRTERLNFISTLSEIIVHLSQDTNDISRTYLYHAARGKVSSRLVNLASAVCAGSRHIQDCAKSAMQSGHTSGMDAVTGLLFGLAAWDILPL
jgi:hypothetical protein